MEKTCTCGSGEPRWLEYDARGIPLTYVCDKCRAAKLKRYRPDVLDNPNYIADEQVEEE